MTLGPSKFTLMHLGILFLIWSTAVTSSLENQNKQKVHKLYLGAGNNGALQLIIEAYVESILKDLQNDASSSTKLSKTETSVIRNRMRGLPHHLISHPAINERRLWVGRTQPQFDPYFWKSLKETNEESVNADYNDIQSIEMPQFSIKNPARKRDHEEFLSEEICATNRTWIQIFQSKDLDNRAVNVVQHPNFQQWIFVYECVENSRPCTGISRNYNSKCEMRHGWVNMYHTIVGNPEPKWGYVETPHHCACKITRKPNRNINCFD
ncbi:hypothetical protein CHUAL_002070 [Chamberlinius hualienensis]